MKSTLRKRTLPEQSRRVRELRERTRATLDQLRAELLSQRVEVKNQAGESQQAVHWVGELSSSALSTATAVSAISATLLYASETQNARPDDPDDRHPAPSHRSDKRSVSGDQANKDSAPPTLQDEHVSLIKRGMSTLRASQNDDGGYGDTDRSYSNIATSYLVLAASTLAEKTVGPSHALSNEQCGRLESYLDLAGGIAGLRKRYGTDKTFVVPILNNLAIAGLVPWSEVAALPFEAAVFPQSMYRFLRMPVVSYAIPALVAIGQARHFLGPRALPPIRWIRAASVKRTMNVLKRMQPESGGYLEATPLTAFVVMSLAVTGRGGCEVAQRGLGFLRQSITDDNSWPIDTNLATWVTSLAMHALASDPQDDGSWCSEALVRWHLNCQHRRRHPFTGAEPGGWGWTDLSGAVPDGDDTPAAIIALRHARPHVLPELRDEIDAAIDEGVSWLDQLQNRNGGWPTFCRGWGKLPFDRSSTDLTAHALRAYRAAGKSNSAREDAAKNFLIRSQRSDGSWLPLWFGNQDLPDDINPIYGTARVMLCHDSGGISKADYDRAAAFLIKNQNPDGGWGGGPSVRKWITRQGGDCPDSLVSSVEETALALEALTQAIGDERKLSPRPGVERSDGHRRDGEGESDISPETVGGGNDPLFEAIICGVEFLLQSVRDGRHHVAWPIGFYFAKLWYHERLYPLIFATTALGSYLRATVDKDDV
tara:strand:+ start:113459 stop:115585 length:2127 start_codon:yes stop_codon:yes gene_type:complete